MVFTGKGGHDLIRVLGGATRALAPAGLLGPGLPGWWGRTALANTTEWPMAAGACLNLTLRSSCSLAPGIASHLTIGGQLTTDATPATPATVMPIEAIAHDGSRTTIYTYLLSSPPVRSLHACC